VDPVSRHDELRDLLGVYALDAVDDDERDEVATHLEGCAECRRELAVLQTSVAHLSGVGDEFGELALRAVGGPIVGSPRRRRADVVALVVLAVLVAAAGIFVVRERQATAELREQLDATSKPLDVLAEATVDGSDVRLVGGDRVVDVVVLADGRSLLWRDNLARLAPDLAYHLWGVVDGDVVDVGPLGRDPQFVVSAIPPGSSELIITQGPASRVQPTDTVVATGVVTAR
jgi:Putative zinc-finger